ncbi:MAG: tRNA-dihydrouridine synthase family protein [Alphaproteobacteria bacterium]|nr:tRNA-dihydrouridine synthase family protein [Alphaproteobacteria bacterium]
MQIHFAPIQGYTDSVFRNAHNKLFGASISKYYTPFIRLEKGSLRKHDKKEADTERNGEMIEKGLLVPQILPSNTEEADIFVNELALIGYKEMDINLGCPFPMIAKHHKGCGLLPYPDEIANLLNVTERHKGIRFSIKMRLGLEYKYEWKELVETINNTPLEHVTIHPRTGRQQYRGETDFETYGEMLAAIKHPVVYNGDIVTPDDAHLIMSRYPHTSALMIGRGLLANPCLALEISTRSGIKHEEKKHKIEEFHEILLDGYQKTYDGGEAQILLKMKTLWEYLLPGIEKREKKRITKSKNLQEYIASVQAALMTL